MYAVHAKHYSGFCLVNFSKSLIGLIFFSDSISRLDHMLAFVDSFEVAE